MRPLTLAAFLFFIPSITTAAEWKPAAGPLLTRWAKDVSPDKVHPEYPRPQMVRKEWQNLNGLWQFAAAKEGDQPPVGKRLPEQILVPFPVESALSGVMKRAERVWYRRTFSLPKEWKERRVLLHFGAVDWEAKVWVNGKPVGEHRGGYDPFSFDITEALKAEGDQELVIGVWDPTDKGYQPRGKQVSKPGGIYYTPTTGIWQTVWLEPVRGPYVRSLRITPDVDKGEVVFLVDVVGRADSVMVGRKTSEISHKILGGGAPGKPFRIKIDDPKLWSPDSPYLYDVDIGVLEKDIQSHWTDTVSTYFAMRKVAVGKDDQGVTRLLLNGKPVFQVGPLDQGFWPDGLHTAPTDEALKYDIEVTRKLGFNMTRKHVKVEPARWYYWCDKLGLLVWQDMPSGERSVGPNKGEIKRSKESAGQFERELKAMIDALHNHPSVIMWVVFNEGWGQYDTKRITDWVKQYDPSRLVNNASGWNDMRCGDVHDVHVYPGPGAPPREEGRAAVLGEFGGLGLPVEGHMWSKENWGYRGMKTRDELMRRYERLLRETWRLKDSAGLSAAVYTQLTDVETEANGLLTYDRAVFKVDVERAAAVNRGDFSKVPEWETVVPSSREKPQTWRYTFEKPADGWQRPGFDDSGWQEGPGGFGAKGTPGSAVRTEWKTNEIWLRREVELGEGPFDGLHLLIHHDEDAEVYLNGVPAATFSGYVTDYEEAAVAKGAVAALRPGKNRIAVRCKQTGGGQYIDVGLVRVKK